MKYLKRIMAIMLTALLMFALPVQMTVNAADGSENSANPDAVGLITSHSATLTSGNKRVLINASVKAGDIMAKLGFKDIIIQQSTSSSGSWSTYFSPSDQLAENVKNHYLDNFLISVPGGYYYRVQLTFYAKEQGWFFPSTESITATTNTVYVA